MARTPAIKPNLSGKRLGWIPDIPDHRDRKLHLVHPAPNLESVDLRPQMPVVYDQEQLGSCTSHSSAALAQFLLIKEKAENFTPSRLFIYYVSRYYEGTVNEDSGAMLRDSMKAMAKYGCPHETLWPYDITKFTRKAPKPVYADALKHQILSYARINQDIHSMESCLASGFPFVFGFTVYSSFDSIGKDGVMTMPTENDKDQGGHAVCAVGYKRSEKVFIIRNSWGPDWGDNGYFYMPYDYISNTNLAEDFWTARLIEV